MSGLGKKALGEGLLKEDLTYPECFIFFFFFFLLQKETEVT